MPSRTEVRAYELGIRLQQAIAITASAAPESARLLNAITAKLQDCINDQAMVATFPATAAGQLRSLIQPCTRFMRAVLNAGHQDNLRDPCRHFNEQLEVVKAAVLAILPERDESSPSAQTWFRLGLEITDGWPKPVRRGYVWTWVRPKMVEELLQQLNVEKRIAFPEESDLSGSEVSYFPDVLPEETEGWYRVEEGLNALKQVACPEVPAEPLTAVERGSTDRLVPRWDGTTGELIFRGRLVKKVREQHGGSNVRTVLDCFEEKGWPSTINNPLEELPSGQRLHDTIKSLNKGLSGISFHSDGYGTGFSWRISR
jgi:hypothetical protein